MTIDPLSITCAVATLVATSAKGLRSCNDLAARYRDAPQTLMVMRTECNTVKLALDHIYWLTTRDEESLASRLGSDSPLAETFDAVLNGCGITFALLEEQLAVICAANSEKDEMSWTDRMRTLWNEEAIKSTIDQMRSIHNAINLLLTVLQTESLASMRQMLITERPVIDSIRQTPSFMLSSDVKSQLTETGTSDDTEGFSFDYILFNSKVCRKALRTFLKDSDQSHLGSSTKLLPIQDDAEPLIDFSSSIHTVRQTEKNESTAVEDLHDLDMSLTDRFETAGQEHYSGQGNSQGTGNDFGVVLEGEESQETEQTASDLHVPPISDLYPLQELQDWFEKGFTDINARGLRLVDDAETPSLALSSKETSHAPGSKYVVQTKSSEFKKEKLTTFASITKTPSSSLWRLGKLEEEIKMTRIPAMRALQTITLRDHKEDIQKGLWETLEAISCRHPEPFGTRGCHSFHAVGEVDYKTIQSLTKPLKTVLVGDSGCGKSSLLLSLTQRQAPVSHGASTMNQSSTVPVTVLHGDQFVPFFVQCLDSRGSDNHEKDRKRKYPGTDLFLLCFRLTHNRMSTTSGSLENVFYKWLPETQACNPGADFVLVGIQSAEKMKASDSDTHLDMAYDTGVKAAQESGALAYLECNPWLSPPDHIFDSIIAITSGRRMQNTHSIQKKSSPPGRLEASWEDGVKN